MFATTAVASRSFTPSSPHHQTACAWRAITTMALCWVGSMARLQATKARRLLTQGMCFDLPVRWCHSIPSYDDLNIACSATALLFGSILSLGVAVGESGCGSWRIYANDPLYHARWPVSLHSDCPALSISLLFAAASHACSHPVQIPSPLYVCLLAPADAHALHALLHITCAFSLRSPIASHTVLPAMDVAPSNPASTPPRYHGAQRVAAAAPGCTPQQACGTQPTVHHHR